ncbi:L-serine ammonia-lyase [Stackebrandtia albiflava]|uniref:L-serine dehydratase n=1 Tax=Stackebrandtia albiflava TaxID=406432 RepID=A0A562V1I2_9ACTN|nr:L-serine ammonia-lyase [Stackebrandtia albiflava]TWJ11780.1 L-serine ammonia-lyase [Stackebrandtia albiflava]
MISVFDLFKIGIGPSSSHTVGPMRAARTFVEGLKADGMLSGVTAIRAELFGSLGATGHGHGSGPAVLLGLEGEDPETVDTRGVTDRVDAIHRTGRLNLLGVHHIDFHPDTDLTLHRRRSLPFHPNGMVFAARDANGAEIRERTYYSVGGGFVVDESAAAGDSPIKADDTRVTHPFTTGAELLDITERTGSSISQVMLANELAWRSKSDVREGLLRIWQVMRDCVHAGCHTEGRLPGGLKVPRRASELYRRLRDEHQAESDLGRQATSDPLQVMDWVTLFALAVNEENAAGGRVVTAPTNGAAGIVPAVLHYYWRYVPGAGPDGVVRFLLTAAAIGVLFKENASISGAEVGCQGEVGSACSMAAAGLTEVLGGTPAQVENAAEIAMEHNLGLTCDPVGGLVQIPCIERNAVASIKAITAARLAMRGDGRHTVSLDKVIKTMRETGADMKVKYKETSRGGLAVNVIEC